MLLGDLDRAAAARHIHSDGDHAPYPGLRRPVDHRLECRGCLLQREAVRNARLQPPLRREVRQRVKLVAVESVPILPAALGRDVGILGAAAVVV